MKRLKFKVMLQGTMVTTILSATQHYSIVATLGSLSNDDGDGNENGKKAIDWQNNNVTRASRFFVHFVAVVALLQRESAS